jgi:hypothetical protein
MSVAAIGVRLIALALLTTMSIPPSYGGSHNRRFEGLLVVHIDHEGQRPASGFDDFGSRAVDRAGQFEMGRVGLGGDGDIGAVPSGPRVAV